MKRIIFSSILLSLLLTAGDITAQECEYRIGDCDHNGTPWELTDVVAMIGYYRGLVVPYYTCDCPPHGSEFMPDADPDADCVPFELSDIMAVLVPPDWPPFGGCPDCPGDTLTVPQEAGAGVIVPTLKAKARLK